MALIRYTALRVLVFGVVTALLWLVGLRGFVLALVAVLVSGILSIFVLNRSRDQLSASLDRRLAAIKERTEAEDAWDDARRAAQARAATESGTEPTDVADGDSGSEVSGPDGVGTSPAAQSPGRWRDDGRGQKDQAGSDAG